jgi:hypothetical protein
MNVGIGNEAVQFQFLEHLFRIFGTVSLQCIKRKQARIMLSIVHHIRAYCGVSLQFEVLKTLVIFTFEG